MVFSIAVMFYSRYENSDNACQVSAQLVFSWESTCRSPFYIAELRNKDIKDGGVKERDWNHSCKGFGNGGQRLRLRPWKHLPTWVAMYSFQQTSFFQNIQKRHQEKFRTQSSAEDRTCSGFKCLAMQKQPCPPHATTHPDQVTVPRLQAKKN